MSPTTHIRHLQFTLRVPPRGVIERDALSDVDDVAFCFERWVRVRGHGVDFIVEYDEDLEGVDFLEGGHCGCVRGGFGVGVVG